MEEEKKKPDRRIQKTDCAIFQALLRLTEKKKLEDISVTQLCEEADISRKAFYSRYRDPIHAVESYIDAIYTQGIKIPVAYETTENRNKKLGDLWKSNMHALKLILVTSQNQHIYDSYVNMVARLYTELNRVPRRDIPAAEPNDISFQFELNLATIHARMMKQQIENNSDGVFEKQVMDAFISGISQMKKRTPI